MLLLDMRFACSTSLGSSTLLLLKLAAKTGAFVLPSRSFASCPITANVLTMTQTRRRSPRLAAAASTTANTTEPDASENTLPVKKVKAATKTPKGTKKSKKASPDKKRKVTTATKKSTTKKKKDATPSHLPRPRETELLESSNNNETVIQYVMGIDEAGRGPLCGPVVAAAAVVPTNILGVTDSKKLTSEEMREALYEQIVSSPNVRWAVAVMDAQRIDEINILQATLEGMRFTAEAVMGTGTASRRDKADISELGCYVVSGSNDADGKPIEHGQWENWEKEATYALIDGNRLPKEMPCAAETMVKGDSREYAIGAASILAKVTRDRLMHAYHELYPIYDLKQNKGYPTKHHMAAVLKHGAVSIHRRTFAPLKHMNLTAEGKIIKEDE